MNDQNQSTIQRRLQELNELHYSPGGAVYEAALQTAIEHLQQTFPGFTIAFAEIWSVGIEPGIHGGMCHVLMPTAHVA